VIFLVKSRRKGMQYILLTILVGIVVMLVLFIIKTRTPVKYAVRLEDIHEYPNSILVREAFHTGTGWEKIGNEHGVYENEQGRVDVILQGNLPPFSDVGAVNTYLCEVKDLGPDIFPPLGDEELFAKYEVLEWYPIYPVKRDTLLPSWFYPKDYLSVSDKKQ